MRARQPTFALEAGMIFSGSAFGFILIHFAIPLPLASVLKWISGGTQSQGHGFDFQVEAEAWMDIPAALNRIPANSWK